MDDVVTNGVMGPHLAAKRLLRLALICLFDLKPSGALERSRLHSEIRGPVIFPNPDLAAAVLISAERKLLL